MPTANNRMVARQVGSDVFYYIKDALGSTRQVWKHGATTPAFSVATYKPFGTSVSASGTEKFKYAGEMLVDAAGTSPGLYYISARWMDPELGRWLSLDPELGRLSQPQSMNRYVYCVNNPLRFTDPTGTRGEGTAYHKTLWELHNQYPMTWDEFFTGLGYIPVVDIVSDLYFLGKAIYYQDWGSAALYAGCAALPFVGSSYVKTGAKSAAKQFGVKWLDDLVTITKRAPDPPTTPLKNVDVPNPYGRAGGPLHQAKISEVIDDIRRRGLDFRTEFHIKGPGIKRFADVVALEPGTKNVLEIYQIGRITKAGNPVAREIRAIADIESVISLKVLYVPYFTP